LSAEPIDSELATRLADAEAQNERLRKRLDENKKSGVQTIDANEAKKIEAKFEFAKKEWLSRKRKVPTFFFHLLLLPPISDFKFVDICDILEENMESKKMEKLKVCFYSSFDGILTA
jgi:hypothetical protein